MKPYNLLSDYYIRNPKPTGFLQSPMPGAAAWCLVLIIGLSSVSAISIFADQPPMLPVSLAVRSHHESALSEILSDNSSSLVSSLGFEEKVLGESVVVQNEQTQKVVPIDQVQNLVEQMLDVYVTSGWLKGEKGDRGDKGDMGSVQSVDNGNGQTTSVINSQPVISYLPPVPQSNFSGGSIQGVGILTADVFSAGKTSIAGPLTVSGSANFTNSTNLATTTVNGDLTVNGNVTAATFYGDGSHLTGIVTGGGGSGTSTSQWLTATSTSNIFYNLGNVGVGTTTPATQLSVSGSSQVTGHMALGNLGGVDSQIFGFGGVSQSVANYPTNLNINDYRTGDLSNGAVGVSENLTVYGSFAHTGSSTAYIYGADVMPVITASSTGPIGQFNGSEFLPWNYGSGAIDFMSGVVGGTFNEKSGTVNKSIGLTGYSENDGGGTINNGYGVFASSALNYGTGTIGSAYGVYVDLPHNGAGTVNNNYGLYISDQSGMATTANNFNLYSAGTTAINYIEGKMGIGTTSPQYLLQVGSIGVASGTVARFQNTNGTCDINPTNASLQCSSDQRLKQNITSMADMLDKVLALRPVFFNWNNEATGTPEHPGFIAQEVEKIFPELVSTDPQTGYKSISYSNFAPYLVQAVAEQQQEILTLQGSLTGNATTSSLSVYSPGSFSGDSVGQAKILAGQTSVTVTFSAAYGHQPIVVADAIDVFTQHAITNITASGFTITIPNALATDVTFNWHSFASPDEQLTISDGSKQQISLVINSGNSNTIIITTPPTNNDPGQVAGDSTSTPSGDSTTTIDTSTPTPTPPPDNSTTTSTSTP